MHNNYILHTFIVRLSFNMANIKVINIWYSRFLRIIIRYVSVPTYWYTPISYLKILIVLLFCVLFLYGKYQKIIFWKKQNSCKDRFTLRAFYKRTTWTLVHNHLYIVHNLYSIISFDGHWRLDNCLNHIIIKEVKYEK